MNGFDKIKIGNEVRKMTIIEEEESNLKPPPGFGVRHQQCVLLFCGLSIAYCFRVCLGVALVAMVDDEVVQSTKLVVNASDVLNAHNGTVHGITSFSGDNFTAVVNTILNKEPAPTGILHLLLLSRPYPKFQWSKNIQDVILSSFFWGYMILQIPGSHLMQKFGAKYMLFGSLCINGFIGLIFPWAAYYGNWPMAVVCRIVMGLSQACFMPGMHMFFGRWAPLEERGRLTAYAYGGASVGAVIGLPITGFIADSPFGWPGIFRFYGLVALLMAAFIWRFCSEFPADHPKMTLTERMYIEKGLGKSESKKKATSVPWKSILTDKGMWAIIFAHIGNTWGTLTIYTEIPAYLNKVLDVNIKANGLLTALPFFVMWLSNMLFSYITDMLIVKKVLSITNTRKLAQVFGSLLAAIGFVVISFLPNNIYAFEAMLVFICTFKIATHSGFHVNHIDISPNFAGPMMSISNFFSNLFGSLSPTIAGLILTDVTDATLWRRVFLVTVGWYILTTTVYVILGSGEVAAWNEPNPQSIAADDEAQEEMLKTADKSATEDKESKL